MYKKIKSRYNKGYIRIDQLKRYVELGVITPKQYETICGEEYAEEIAHTETLRQRIRALESEVG